jgi:hypothetical protein
VDTDPPEALSGPWMCLGLGNVSPVHRSPARPGS